MKIYNLVPAILVKDKLISLYQNNIHTEKFKYYNPRTYVDFDLKLSTDTWNCEEYAIVDETEIIGFICITKDNVQRKISNISICSFGNKNIFPTVYKKIKQLITLYRKIEFDVVVGNPVEKIYDYYVEKMGGRIVGVHEQFYILSDGKYYDRKSYEILNF